MGVPRLVQVVRTNTGYTPGAGAAAFTAKKPEYSTVDVMIDIVLNGSDTVEVIYTDVADTTKTSTAVLNNGTALVAGRLYQFMVGASDRETYTVATVGATQINRLLVREQGENLV